ncbi:nucleoporin nup211 [Dorcoceras hygrometricum]|uniref:Nucleoporin nup211 n=1 Tax=Dorcoceras hygrometricum TaxID=472368 RepID=A0A2Z7ATI6_9LAMI|nr:nucleoporin nup211 [Dorcoceras hygrometricum]
MVEDQQAEFCTEQPADELPAARSAASTEERHLFDLSYEELITKWADERQITSPADSYDEIKDDKPVVDNPETIINQVLQNLDSTSDDKDVEPVVEAATMDVVTAGEDQQVQEFLAQNVNDDLLDADEQKSLEDILLEIPVDVPLPSAGMEITKIVMGKTIKIPGVTEKSWFLNSLHRIPADDKGKEILELTTTARAHGLIWKKPCCSMVFEGSPRDRGAVIARTNTNTRSSCWIRTMILVDGVWTVEPCADKWVKIPRQVISHEVHRQRQFDDTLPSMSVFFRLMRKRWADVCLEVAEFCGSRRLLPVGSINFCRALEIVETDSCVDFRQPTVFTLRDTLPSMSVFFRVMRKRWADVCLEVAEFCGSRRLLPVGSINFCRALEIVETDSCVDFRQPTVFTLRLSQFCTVHIQYSLFSRLSTTDISDFLSTIALDRTALRSVQRSFAESVVPSVQFSLDQRQSSPISTDSSSSLRFDTTDVDATASSLPPVSQDFSAALSDLQAILSEQIYESQSGISSKLHKIEHGFRDSLNEQSSVVKKLFQEACQEGRSIDDVQTIRFNEFRKNILAQNASIFVGLADVRKEVEEVNAKVDIMASRLNAVQKDAEATKEALSHQLFEFQSQAQENQNILHAQLSELVDYIHRGSADKKGESGSRGPQQTSNVQIEGSAERTPTFAQRVEMAQRHILHTVLDADANRALLERQAAAERDRERIRREARMLKRRRRD